jgi:hypothetical protein
MTRPGQLGRLGSPLALAFIVVGLLAILVGYNGVAGNIAVAAQLPYVISGGFLGVALVVVGAALMVTHGAREDRQRVEGLLLELLEATQAGGAPRPAVPGDVEGLFAAGTASYHRPDCRLVEGRDALSYVTAAEAEERRLKPCRVCHPESVDVPTR